MKKRKVFTYIMICVFAAGLLSSCAIDKKCPAYSKADAGTSTTASV